MNILVTCFEPFGRDAVNASRLAVDRLPDAIGEHTVRKLLLPVSFHRCSGVALDAIRDFNPDMVIMTGQAAREAVCLERLAINWAISRTPDNDGVIAPGERIAPDAPDAIFTTFPVDAMAASLALQTGLPVKASNTAGTFVCNRLYFDLLHHCQTTPSLFVHLPLSPAQAATRGASTPSLPTAEATAILHRLLLYCTQM